MADKYNLTVVQGDDVRLTVTWEDSAGDPVDLTGYSAAAQVRATYAGDVLVEIDCDITDPTAGEIMLHALATDTALLTANGVWDLQLTDTNDEITTLLRGRVRLQKEVTR